MARLVRVLHSHAPRDHDPAPRHGPDSSEAPLTALPDRLLRPFGDVRRGEGAATGLLLCTLFLILCGYQGGMLAAGLVLVGTTWLSLEARGFAGALLFVIAVWTGVAWMLVREYGRRTRQAGGRDPHTPATAARVP